MGKLQWKRVYDAPEDSDGYRILIDRLWPRGMKKEAAELSDWAKDIAPSTDLRKKYHHGEISYEDFAAAYDRELSENPGLPAFAEEIKDRLRNGNVTLLYAGKEPDKSQIPTLRAHINKHEHIS